MQSKQRLPRHTSANTDATASNTDATNTDATNTAIAANTANAAYSREDA